MAGGHDHLIRSTDARHTGPELGATLAAASSDTVGLLKRYSQLITWFLARQESPDTRARIFVGAALGCAALMSLIAGVETGNYGLFDEHTLRSLSVVSVGVVALSWIRWTGKHRIPALLLAYALQGMMLSGSMSDQHHVLTLTMGHAVLGLVGPLVFGGVLGNVVSLGVILQYTAVSVMRAPADLSPLQNTDMVSSVLALVAVIVMASVFEHNWSRAERRAEERREQAERASLNKSRFLATMSHGVRTPLNGVMGMTRLLKDTPLNADQRLYLDTVSRSAESLLHVLHEVMDYTAIESGELVLRKRPFDPRVMVEDVAELHAQRAQAKGLEFSLLIPPDLPSLVEADLTRVQQVLTNLVSNAVEYTDAGHVELRVSLPAPGRLRFEVEDTGPGLDEQSRERLFEAFVEVQGSSTQRFGSLGLGLVISQLLCQALGGELGLSSEPGRGSTFWAELPIAVLEPAQLPEPSGQALVLMDSPRLAEACLSNLASLGLEGRWVRELPGDLEDVRVVLSLERQALPEGVQGVQLGTWHEALPGALRLPLRRSRLAEALQEFASRSAERRDLAGLHVLVVDDNRVNLMVASGMLKSLGATVSQAIDGREAVEKVKAASYDAVLMDCQMPRMDGVDATRAIRELGITDLPIIALTGNALEGDREFCLQAGMNDFLTKPSTPEQLLRTIGRWVSAT